MNHEFSPSDQESIEAIRKRMEDRRERTAYHESGHAVISEFFGYPVLEVSIVPTEERRGRCSRTATVYTGLKEAEARVHAINGIIICFAGHAAESLISRHHAPHTANYISRHGGKTDCEKALRLLPKILGELDRDATRWEREACVRLYRAYLNFQVARAYKLVRSEPLRTVVTALANELLGWDELTGEEAREVMAKALRSRETDFQTEHSPACPRNPAE